MPSNMIGKVNSTKAGKHLCV